MEIDSHLLYTVYLRGSGVKPPMRYGFFFFSPGVEGIGYGDQKEISLWKSNDTWWFDHQEMEISWGFSAMEI